MRADVTAPGELTLTIDVGGLPVRREDTAWQAGLPGTAPGLADEITGILAVPQPAPPPPQAREIRAITVRLVRTEVIATEPLMLDSPKQVYA